jgi:hypothetical protein
MVAAVVEATGVGCVYPCLRGKGAMGAFLVSTNTFRDYDGLCAFQATYRTPQEAADGERDAKHYFPHVSRPRPDTVIGHFAPGAARSFVCFDCIEALPQFICEAEAITSLKCILPTARHDELHKTRGAKWGSVLIAGALAIERAEEMNEHSPGGYLLKVEHPTRLWLHTYEWWNLTPDTIAFLKSVAVTHIPLTVCKYTCSITADDTAIG